MSENDEAWIEKIEQRLDDLCEYWPEGDFKAAYRTDVALLTTEYRRLQFATDGLVAPRVWFYKPGSYLRAWPVTFGSDEWCRKTLVLGNWLTGCIVIALWQMDDPECPDCMERRGDDDA